MPSPAAKADFLQEVINDLGTMQHDPLRYVLYVFPWGVKGTTLENETGPRKWQRDILVEIGEKLRANHGRQDDWEVIKEAVASGHGIGKSALVAWLVKWAMATLEDTRGVVTANTELQLRTKTWAELSKWHNIALDRDLFVHTATAYYSSHPKREKTWRVDCVPWNETNTNAFAGLHNKGGRVLLIFDEAAQIPKGIWEVSKGALTDPYTEIVWACFGNPTSATGEFRECFTAMSHRWTTRNIDSRDVEDASNPEEIRQWIEDYGLESNFVKVRVLGQFPDASPNQLIPEEWIWRAVKPYGGDGSVPKKKISADVADGGVDETVISVAIEYATHTHLVGQRKFAFPSSEAPIKTALAMCDMWDGYDCSKSRGDLMIVDSLGVGAGTAGYLMVEKEMPVVAYKGGESSSNPKLWRNRRVQSYINLRNAFRDETLTIDPDCFQTEADLKQFVAQVCSVERSDANDRIEDIVTKEQMKRDGIKSPDRADSVAMIFFGRTPQLGTVDKSAPRIPELIVQRSTMWDQYPSLR